MSVGSKENGRGSKLVEAFSNFGVYNQLYGDDSNLRAGCQSHFVRFQVDRLSSRQGFGKGCKEQKDIPRDMLYRVQFNKRHHNSFQWCCELEKELMGLSRNPSGIVVHTESGLIDQQYIGPLLETGKLEDRARAGRPYLKEARAPCIAVEMEAIASEAASGTSSAREAARLLGLPPSSVRNILRRILQLYPYKLQSCHELLPADAAQREAFAKWAFSKMEQDPTWGFNILWIDEAHFSLHGDFNNHNCRIWATCNPREYTQKPLHFPKVTAWCGFTGSFIIGPPSLKRSAQ
ncbi:uncharacterized protein TNCV_2018121 [Trichonephila clavipes]|nr:uncharacterized protein TNCV_2018121 [Trichonephila clavipes]